MYNGWTPTIPEDEQCRNLIKSCLAFLDIDPTNAYWQARLAEAEAPTVAELVDAEYGQAQIVDGVSSPEWFDSIDPFPY